MKLAKKVKVFGLVAMLAGMVCTMGSCKPDEPEKVDLGKVTGTVMDAQAKPIDGVTVTVNGSEATATTDEQGTYTLENVTIASHVVTFSKDNYLTTSVSISASSFRDGVAEASPVMEYAAAKIKGKVTNASADDAPFEGVTVSVSPTQTAMTDANGEFEIANLPLADYTVTFEKEGFSTVTKNVTIADFKEDGVATVEARLGATEVLRGLTADDLRSADKWYYNEYRGGRNAEAYPHWDWSTDYMATLDFRGAWEEQNEGTTLQIRNTGDEQKNPADMTMFDSFVFGSKEITADNNIMTLQVRTHNATEEAPTKWGVQVVDLSEAEPKAVLIDEVKELASDNYKSVSFDLSAYDGKEVVIAIGTFRAETGDYYKQLVLRRIAFAKEALADGSWGWLPGTSVAELDGYEMTEEMVRSTMPHQKKSFTGISPVGGNRDNYVDAYRAWREAGHIGAEWSFMPVQKDPEPFPSEGYVMKTKGGEAEVSTTKPQAYFYTKFSIAAGNNKLTLSTRTFGSNATFFKLTAITEDCVVKHMSPASNTAQEAEAAADGCWKFKHDAGTADNPDAYAKFVYDLSEFDGKDVVIAIAVFKGEANGDENKLAFHSVTME